MKQTILGAIFVSALGIPSALQAGSISPETDSSGMFSILAKREMTVGTDPRTDAAVAVQTSYFEYREATQAARPMDLPFAPEMPQVAPRELVSLPVEESAALHPRR